MPTIKQKLVAKDLLENVGKPVSKAMLDAGYTPAMAKNPQVLTKSVGWLELMEDILPDDKLIQTHAEGLKATKLHTSHTEPDREVADYAVRHKYLETAYKLKKRLSNENGLTINESQVLVVPAELINKNDISPDSVDSSQGSNQV